MVRSFNDRILGGVCGGLAVGLPLGPWTLRVAFILLTVITLGLGLPIYLALWWLMPQESLISPSRGGAIRALLALIVIAALSALWFTWLTDSLPPDLGGDRFFSASLLLVMGSVLFLRQLRG